MVSGKLDDRGATLKILNEMRSLNNKFEKSDDSFQKIVKTLTEEILALKTVIRQLPNPNGEADTSLLSSLPFDSLKEFKEFDEKLSLEDGVRAQLKNILQRVGGKDYPTFLRMAIKTVLTDELAMNLTWRGTCDKPSAQKFTSFKLIKDTCYAKYSNVTDTNINKVCQLHIVHAKDRIQKRQKTTSQET